MWKNVERKKVGEKKKAQGGVDGKKA